MNKKIFAALASATMALSATGSLAVFAEDFDVVTEADGNNGAGAGLVVPNGKVKLTTDNFPDAGLIKDIIAWGTTAENTSGALQYGSEFKAGDVKNLTIANETKNLDGVNLFGNLETLTSTSKVLANADLSENAKLKSVNISNAASLNSVQLPAGKTLTDVTVLGPSAIVKAPLTEINLSQNKFLNEVNIQNTNVAKIDLSNNVYMTKAYLSNNDLNTVDITNCASLTAFFADGNELYGIELPENKVLTVLNLSNNLLQELDVTPTPNLQVLLAENNELRNIDLSDIEHLNQIRLGWNHLGALNIPKANVTALDSIGWSVDDTTKSNVNPQVVYVDSTFNAVNLGETFEDLDEDLVVADDADAFNDKTTVLKLDGDVTHYLYKANSAGTPAYWGVNVYVAKAEVLNRLYNPNSGEHFYTKDLDEKDALVELGWKDEGIGWVSPMEKFSAEPVYRLYNPNAGDHHYTKNAFERDTLTSVGWKYEGIGWYSYNPDKVKMTVAGYGINPVNVLREYNPNAKAAGAHNYTINPAENDFLVSVGWLDEGVAWGSLK